MNQGVSCGGSLGFISALSILTDEGIVEPPSEHLEVVSSICGGVVSALFKYPEIGPSPASTPVGPFRQLITPRKMSVL